MAKVQALTVQELDARADAFEEVVVEGMHKAVRESIERAYRERVITAAAADEEVDPQGFLEFIQQYWAVFVYTVLGPFLADAMSNVSGLQFTGLTGALIDATSGSPREVTFARNLIDEPLDTEIYIQNATNRLVGIGDDLWENARDELIDGIDEGESIDQLADRVRDAVDVSEPRARSIARTESNGAMNAVVDQTNHAVSAMFGVEGGIRKEWSSTHDLRTRPTHVAADGQTVDLDEPFIVGNASLQFPSDPTGPPGETINCRCTTLTVISDELLGATSNVPQELPMTAADQEEEMPYDIVQGGGTCAEDEWAVIKQGTTESVGCHASEEDARAQVAAIMASESEDEGAAPTGANALPSGFATDIEDEKVESEAKVVDPDEGRFVTWSGVIAVEGVPTGDGRQFSHNALTWADLPMSLGWMYERAHGGMATDKVVTVGQIDTIERGEGGIIVATGKIDTFTGRGWEVARMMGTREQPGSLAGISIDADDPERGEVEYVFPDGCEITNDDTLLAEGDELVDDMKCMMPELEIYSTGRIRAATLVDIPAFVEARIYLDQPFGSTDEGVLLDDEEVLLASSYTMTLNDVPPASWFDEPVDEPDIGAITVTDEGRIFGYLAPKNVAHRGIRDKRVEVPMKNVDYGIWMNRTTIADDGNGGFTRLATGPITMDCGHAPMSNRVTGQARQQHYDNSCSIVATARVGENSRGVWIAGAILPDVTADQVRRMMMLQLSGDWGPHREKPGYREMAGALLVPRPGFPKRSFSSMTIKRGVLTHVGVPLRFAVSESRDDTKTFGTRAAADRIAASVGRDRVSRIHELAARVRGL